MPGARCPHCGAAVEGAEETYCCPGCEVASQIIRQAGLERYYRERKAYAPRPERSQGHWSSVPLTAHGDGTVEAALVIDGLRCASCVWLTENILQRTPGVTEASVSYATGRATVRWDRSATDLSAVADRIASLGYRPRILGEASAVDRGLVVRLGVAVFGAMNIMLLSSAVYAGWFGDMAPRFLALFQWMILVLATPVALWCAEPFFSGAVRGLRHGMLHMDVPIALAIGVLYLHGVAATLVGGDSYLDSMAMLVALLLAGRVLESRSRRRAAESATSLAASVPATARRWVGDRIESVAADSLQPGDMVHVGVGEEAPADGVVTEGRASANLALITGESRPVVLADGDRVVAGAVILGGSLTVQVDRAGQDTLVRRMARDLRAAAERPLRRNSTDRIAPWFTAATLVAALGAGAFWLLEGGGAKALEVGVAVLVVACPCALALSRPLAGAAGLGSAARRGAMIRSTEALLDLAHLDTIAVDKTGTVTLGELTVTRASNTALRIAAGLERFSNHPVARAIVGEAVARGIPLPLGSEVRETVGRGISGTVDGLSYTVESNGPASVRVRGPGCDESIDLGDVVRPDSPDQLERWRHGGYHVALLTGDDPAIAKSVASDAGIEVVLAGADPQAKADWVESRQRQGHRVLFVGDGANDGPALAQADVGLAMGGGAASSLLVADGVVSARSLAPVEAALCSAAAASRAVRRNQMRAIGYNVLAVGAAMAGLINPLIAAVMMPLSSSVVIWESVRVERVVRRALS